MYKAIQVDTQYRETMEVMKKKLEDGKIRSDKKTGKQQTWSNYFDRKKTREEKDPNAMDIDAMSTEKRAALMKKGACFICEETGHLARDHKEHEKKNKDKGKGKASNYTPTPKKDKIQRIHAVLSKLSEEETKQLLAIQALAQKPAQEEEKKEETKEKEEDSDSDSDF